jgi:DNA-binding HxlR family transcriptional regulator
MMPEEPPLTISAMLGHPTTFKILLAMLESEQVYQFQLTKMTGAHRATLVIAIKMLTKANLIKVVEPKVRVKNAGEFYALTPHGVHFANHLKDLAKSLQNSK